MPALFLSPEAPYPIAGGGALRTASLLEYLARHYDVDVIVFRQPGAPDPVALVPRRLARRVTVLDLPANGRSLAARALRNAGARGAPRTAAGRSLRRFRKPDRPARSQAAATPSASSSTPGARLIWSRLAPVCERTVLDLHNVESVLHARCAEVGGRRRGAWPIASFEDASPQLERTWLPRFSRGARHLAEPMPAWRAPSRPHATVAVYPNALPPTPLPPGLATKRPSSSRATWSITPTSPRCASSAREVWPRLRERWPGLVWRLVGKNPEAVRRYTAGDPRIEVTGPVRRRRERNRPFAAWRWYRY